MTPELEGHLHDLIAAVLVTVVFLVITVGTGVKRLRNAHYAGIVGMFASLGVAIAFARHLTPFMVYDDTGLIVKRVHFTFVGITTLMVPFVALSGIRLAKALKLAERGEEHDAGVQRAKHRKLAWWAVVAIVVTCALGTAMTVLGLPD